MDARSRFKKSSGEMPNFRCAAARQNRHHVIVLRQSQGIAGCGAVRHFRNHLCQRVTYVGRGNTVLRQQRRLERKNAQHMVRAAANSLQPVRPPSPDRRADKVHRLDALLAQIFFQLQIEIWRIHADKELRLFNGESLQELLAYTHDFAVAQQHVQTETVHREFFVRPPGLKPVRRHARAADTRDFQARPALSHGAKQKSRQQIPRGLTGHHRHNRRRIHLRRTRWRQRTMPRWGEVWRKNSTIISASGAVSG